MNQLETHGKETLKQFTTLSSDTKSFIINQNLKININSDAVLLKYVTGFEGSP